MVDISEIHFTRCEYTSTGDIILYDGEYNGSKFIVMHLFFSSPKNHASKTPLHTHSKTKTYKTNHWTKVTHTYHKRLM